MHRVLVISPGVLPLPPVLGGAVENMIHRLHSAAAQSFEMEYVSVRPPENRRQAICPPNSAVMHYIESINPLEDFTFENQFELHESNRWPGYLDFCIGVVRERQPAIIHIHNEAHLLHPLRQACPNARLLLHVNDEVVTRMRPEELHDLAKSCDLILSCSQHIDQEIKKAFTAANVHRPPAEVFYNFVDTQEYDPSAIHPEELSTLRNNLKLDDSPIVLFVGRMIEQKGPHLVLRAFKEVLNQRPDARLLFVGAPWYSRTNESPFITWMRTEAAPISDRIQFTGYVDHKRMPVYYALGDVVCAPSIWDDPSPFVAYEAQAMAKPVLASTRGGIPEIVEDRVTGRCIDVFNSKLFSQILIDWLNRPEVARQVGDFGRQRVVEHFEISKAEQQLLRVYQCLVRQDDYMSEPSEPVPTN